MNIVSIRTGRLLNSSEYLRRLDEVSRSAWKHLCIEGEFSRGLDALSGHPCTAILVSRTVRVDQHSPQCVRLLHVPKDSERVPDESPGPEANQEPR
jgi:hypothetical protein